MIGSAWRRLVERRARQLKQLRGEEQELLQQNADFFEQMRAALRHESATEIQQGWRMRRRNDLEKVRGEGEIERER